MKSRTLLLSLLLSLLLVSPAWAAAAVKVENAWIREPAPGQTVVGGFMDITSAKDASLIRVTSPAATVEMHEMKMQGDVMQMRALQKINLPGGKTVKLEPGGLHLMLEKLRKPLKAGDKLALTLRIKSAGKTETVRVAAEVRSNAPVPAVASSPAAPVPAYTAAGEKTYNRACVACHASGAAGAPRLGDKAAWAPRLKTGMAALYAAALKGKGAMPAKGGQAALSDADVKAAVDYMAARSQ